MWLTPKPRQSNMTSSPLGQWHITLTGSDHLLSLLSSGNNSTYLMSLHIPRVICECELLKLRKCVTRKVLRAQHAHQRPVLFSHSYTVNAGWNLNRICCADESLSWECRVWSSKKSFFQWSTAVHKWNHATKYALMYYLTFNGKGSIFQRKNQYISIWNLSFFNWNRMLVALELHDFLNEYCI